MSLQMSEMKGEVPFDQGLYHNNSYEKLIKGVIDQKAKFWFFQK